MPIRLRIPQLTRRDFLKIAVAVPALGLVEGERGQHGTDPRWGIPTIIGSDPRKFLDQYVFPVPKGRRVNDQVYASSGLENVFFVPLGKRAILFDTGFDHQV